MADKRIEDYSADATHCCERALATLIRCVGASWSDRICLIGGLVPTYLLGKSDAWTAHVGSTDVDLALSLAVTGDGAYRTLEKNLKRAGLQRYRGSSWQWIADVDGRPVVVELLGDDEETPPGQLFRPKLMPPAGSGSLELLRVRGVELAFADFVEIQREVTLVDGARATVAFNVAGLAPFLALKGDCYSDRREPKDVYDVMFTIRNWPGGVTEAGRHVASSPVFEDAFLQSAISRLGQDLSTPEHVGARDYAYFVRGSQDRRLLAAASEDAVLTWRQFESALHDGSRRAK